MRCPTCGTENEPDSRFCGVCGAKLTPAANRVAPTAKIPDDAMFPPQYGGGYASGPASIPPNAYAATGPASIPPQNFQGPASIPPNQQFAASGPASIPPNTYQAPGYVTAPGTGSSPPHVRAPMREPSMSMPAMPPRPRWGLILLVLLLDAGLAGAGAVMLAKGLAKPDSVETAPAAAPVKKAEAAAPQAAPPPPAIEKAAPAIAASIAQATEPPAADTTPTPTTPAKQTAARPKATAASKAPTPIDPYAASSTLKSEIELEAARSRDAFSKCRGDAGDVKGRIDIAMRVETDGRVGDAHINTNSTGSQPLAMCLVTEIRRWAFASHPSQPVELVRPFIY